MYKVHGLSLSSNTTKIIYVLEDLGAKYEYINLDFTKGEHKSPEHMARHPLGKAPTLTHGDKVLFESGAICRYVAGVEKSELYPEDLYQRGVVDQWMMFFTCHLGRHFNTYAFETVAKKAFGMGDPDEAAAQEARKFIDAQLPALEARLAASPYLGGEQPTIADFYGFAYTENAEMGKISFDDAPSVARWYAGLKDRPSVQRAFKVLGRS